MTRRVAVTAVLLSLDALVAGRWAQSWGEAFRFEQN